MWFVNSFYSIFYSIYGIIWYFLGYLTRNSYVGYSGIDYLVDCIVSYIDVQ